MATRYDTRYGLSQPIVNYLNLGLPDISGILGTPQALALAAEEEVAASSSPQIIYSQEGRVGDGSFNPYTMGAGDPGVRGPDDYNPYSARRLTDKGSTALALYPEFYYPKGVTDTGIMGAYKQFRKSPKSLQTGIFGLNLLSGGKLLPAAAGVVAAGDVLGGLLPVSRRGIVENQLLGQGISLDNIGRVVGDPNTAEGIMAGYNAAKITSETFDKRRDRIKKTISEKKAKGLDTTTLEERLGLLDEAEAKFDQANKIGDALYTEKMSAKDPNYKADMDKVRAGLLEGDDDDDDNKAFEEYLKTKEAQKGTSASGIIPFGPNPAFYASQTGRNKKRITGTKTQPGSGKVIIPGGKKIQDNRRDKGPSPINIQKKKIGMPENLSYNPRRDSSPKSNRAGGKKSGAKKSTAKNSSQAGGSFNKLGFSDIRLKENVELIGKSPSNINIYKFNYKDNPTTYQGVMAHEVPWANVKHSNGYMMVDYDKVDVEFKKWLR